MASAELVVALDNCSPTEAEALVQELSRAGVQWFKVGLELYSKAGPSFVRQLKDHGFKVFVDLKLYDIPNTVSKAVGAVVETGADLLTVHCSGGLTMLEAARSAAHGSTLSILGVTVLTSFTEADFGAVAKAWGGGETSRQRGDAALKLAELACLAGLPGIVCSVSDLADGRLQALPWKNKRKLFITPGIRNAGAGEAKKDDQTSVASVSQAVLSGSTHLVVGRPVTAPEAGTPAEAARAILSQLEC